MCVGKHGWVGGVQQSGFAVPRSRVNSCPLSHVTLNCRVCKHAHVVKQPGDTWPFAGCIFYLQDLRLWRVQLHNPASHLNCVKQCLVVWKLENFAVHSAATGVDTAIHPWACRRDSGVIWNRHAVTAATVTSVRLDQGVRRCQTVPLDGQYDGWNRNPDMPR